MIDWLPALRASCRVSWGISSSLVGEVVASAALVGQEVEEVGVGVLADGDRGEGGAVGQGVVDEPLVALSGAGARLAVGEEDDMPGVGVGVADGVQPDGERWEDLGAAIRLDRRDLAVDLLKGRLAVDRRHRHDPFLAVVEDENADLVARR